MIALGQVPWNLYLPKTNTVEVRVRALITVGSHCASRLSHLAGSPTWLALSPGRLSYPASSLTWLALIHFRYICIYAQPRQPLGSRFDWAFLRRWWRSPHQLSHPAGSLTQPALSPSQPSHPAPHLAGSLTWLASSPGRLSHLAGSLTYLALSPTWPSHVDL
jgi:hypothetical protein